MPITNPATLLALWGFVFGEGKNLNIKIALILSIAGLASAGVQAREISTRELRGSSVAILEYCALAKENLATHAGERLETNGGEDCKNELHRRYDSHEMTDQQFKDALPLAKEYKRQELVAENQRQQQEELNREREQNTFDAIHALSSDSEGDKEFNENMGKALNPERWCTAGGRCVYKEGQ